MSNHIGLVKKVVNVTTMSMITHRGTGIEYVALSRDQVLIFSTVHFKNHLHFLKALYLHFTYYICTLQLRLHALRLTSEQIRRN